MKKILIKLLKTFGLLHFAKGLKSQMDDRNFHNQAYQKVLATIQNQTFLLELKELDSAQVEIGRDSHLFKRIFTRSVYEPSTIEVLKNLNLDGDLLDVGANVGIYSIFFAKRVKEGKKVFSFEPHPEMLKLLTRNLERNDVRNAVTIINKAVSDKGGEFDLNFVKGKEEYSSLNEITHQSVANEPIEKTLVEVITIDELVKNNSLQPTTVKIDVEGLELQVLRGMEKTINNFRPDIVVEVSDALNPGVSAKIFEFLEKYGYSFSNIERKGDVRTPFNGNLLASATPR